jgi:hypothetical protein
MDVFFGFAIYPTPVSEVKVFESVVNWRVNFARFAIFLKTCVDIK